MSPQKQRPWFNTERLKPRKNDREGGGKLNTSCQAPSNPERQAKRREWQANSSCQPLVYSVFIP